MESNEGARTLLFLRHGKAQQDAPHGDKARKLIERGRSDSAAMGRLLRTLAKRLDAIISSDAKRALETARIAAASAGFGGEIELEPEIYTAGLSELLDVIHSLPDQARCVLLVGHNPAFEELATHLARERPDDSPVRLPTAGLAQFEIKADRWADVEPESSLLRGVFTPKELN